MTPSTPPDDPLRLNEANEDLAAGRARPAAEVFADLDATPPGDWEVVEAAFAQLGWNMTPVHSLREREAQLNALITQRTAERDSRDAAVKWLTTKLEAAEAREADWAASVEQEQSHLHHCRQALDAAEDRVKELERDLKQADESYEAIRVHSAARMNLIDELQARVAELEEEVSLQIASMSRWAGKAARLEEALREITSDDYDMTPEARRIALRALAHEEETK